MVKKVAAITMVVVVSLCFIMYGYNGITSLAHPSKLAPHSSSLASGYRVEDDLPSMDRSKNQVGTDR